ncbi:MAG: nitroreductase family protein [Thermoplasmata archaeon]|nr:nitroreductase family protein [Thermoplasmata archaeon]
MMDLKEAMENRHSVRRYTGQEIEPGKIGAIESLISEINAEAGLHFELHRGEPNPFTGDGRMINVKDYIALLGEKSADLNEVAGYQGERLVLLMTQLGLDSCWIGNLPIMEKTIAELKSDYELACIIAFGYGEDHGKPHEGKPMSELCKVDGEMPAWFKEGMRYAMLAPTAINQQKFLFTLEADGKVSATYGKGPYSQVDLGIAKLHFELGAGKDNFEWA